MKSEGQISTEKFSVDSRDNTDIANSSDSKRRLCCPMTSCLSTRFSACRRGSATGEINAVDKFDDIDNIVDNYNENAAPSKRKLPRKSKGLNVKSKLRKTFSMCCAHGQDVSLDETDADEFDSIERESRADEDETNRTKTTSDEFDTTSDEQSKSDEVKPLQSFWKLLKPYNTIDEDPNMCSTPTNVLQVYAADVSSLIPQRADILGSGDGGQRAPIWNLVSDCEFSDLTASDSLTSASSCSISALLDEIDADCCSPRKCTYLKDSRPCNFDKDSTSTAPLSQPDDEKTSLAIPINQHPITSKNCAKSSEYQHQYCKNDTPILVNQQQISRKTDPTVSVNSRSNAVKNMLMHIVSQQPTHCKVDGTVPIDSNQTADQNNTMIPVENQTTINSNVQENPRSAGSKNDQQLVSDKIDSTVQVNSQQHFGQMVTSYPVHYKNSNNGAVRRTTEASVIINHERRLLHIVHTMLSRGEIEFVRLPASSLPGEDDGKLVEFIYANSGFSHEEARDLMKGINKLINKNAIVFKFSENLSSGKRFTVSSFNGEKLMLSQEVTASASAEENSSNLTEDMNQNEQYFAPDREETSNTIVSAVINDIFDAADDCVTTLKDYITMIHDDRFSTVLEDILTAGEGRITSVMDYVDILRDGQFSPVLNSIVSVDDDDSNTQLRNYIRTITEGHFRMALENALKACSGNSYTLLDYIRVIRDENIIETLAVILLASDLPDEYVQAIVRGTFDQEADDMSDSSADASTPHSISVQVQRRISAIRENIAIDRNRARRSFYDLPVRNVDGFISPLSENELPRATSSNIPETEVQLSDVNDSDLTSVCDGVSVIQKRNANCHDNTHQDANIPFVDDAPFQQGNIGNEKLQSTKDETHKSKNNCAKWAVSKPIVRQKLFNRETSRPSTRYDSAHQAKNRSKSKYKSSTNQPSSVTIAAADGSSSLDNVSGTSEVKRSKAEHALDLTEKQDSEETSDTTSIQGRIIKTARRRTRGVARQENESTPYRFDPETVSSDEKKEERPTQNQLPPLHSIDSAVVPSADETTPVYIETEATIDYGRCVVEPGHGERPDKKKLRAEIKEKVKTKGEANKHLRPGRENHANDYETMMEEYLAVVIDETKYREDVENEPEEQEECARAASPVILNAVDQPQVLDDREFHLVPEEIKRADDPYLEDVEEDYKVSTTPHSSKKEKRKQKNDRKKEKRSRKGGQTVLKLS
ncbi:uncharacterized protein LOC123530924 [Mercenaria mercenaria]|uniref:uncharacterized protein LOC123530924 n=1 Tax=Mercenaria mercenaria TaxID=6596 RepID=UPI00234F1BF2|nr:uncharacterized protein LOC123530924 [Mercenaria mercenaria]